MLPAICLGAILVGLYIFKEWVSFCRQDKYLQNVPGPKPFPILGNLLDMGGTDHLLKYFDQLRDDYNSLVKIYLGPLRMVILAYDYDFVEMLMSSAKLIDKSVDYKRMRNWIGLGLLTSSGAKWQKRRKLITPSFHFKILENFLEVFQNVSDIFVDKISKHVGKDFDVLPYINLCTLDAICETAMGISMNSQLNEDSEYVLAVKDMSRIILNRTLNPFKSNDFTYRFTGDYYQEQRNLKILHGTTERVIKQRKGELKNSGENTATDDLGAKKRQAFLDALLQATDSDGNKLTDKDIREEVDTFMFEGHDTTSAAVGFALYLLSQNREVQNKAFEELRATFGDDINRPFTYRELQDLKYLEMVINETLRLYPSVPFIGRELSEELTFKGQVFPKGTNVFLPISSIQTDPKYYPNPTEFDPDRFASDNKSTRKPYSYLPFSAGSRNCIGQKYAMLELKSILSNVLRKFELFPAKDFKPYVIAEGVMKSGNGILVRFENRRY